MATIPRLSNPTDLKSEVLQHLARLEVCTLPQLASLTYGPDYDDTNLGSLRRCLRSLRHKNGFVHAGAYCPEGYDDRRLPLAFWLSEEGCDYAKRQWPYTYPRSYGPERSRFTLVHDIKRGQTHDAIQKMCDEREWRLGWKKSDLYHFVKPDDFYEITASKTFHFFHEEENGDKSFKELFEKLEPYVRFHGSSEFKKEWGFRNYNVTIPMHDETAITNVLVHFQGLCNCIDPNAKRKHKHAPYKLDTDILLFTTHEKIVTDTAANIFRTPKLPLRPLSFLDVVCEMPQMALVYSLTSTRT